MGYRDKEEKLGGKSRRLAAVYSHFCIWEAVTRLMGSVLGTSLLDSLGCHGDFLTSPSKGGGLMRHLPQCKAPLLDL